MRNMKWAWWMSALTALAGCGSSNADFLTEERQANGLVVILPGIEGESQFNHDIRQGLVDAGVNRAIPIHSWGRPIPGVGPLLNQMDFVGNRLAGVGVAKMIAQYQDEHPGKPVHVIGHSGGGGVAVFTAEALADMGNRKINGLILISASLSDTYDLSKAMTVCTNGLVNFYNKDDVGLLAIGTTVAGNVDGGHGASCGRVGFASPNTERKRIAFQKVIQIPINESGGDPHTVGTQPYFVSRNVAPWVMNPVWNNAGFGY